MNQVPRMRMSTRRCPLNLIKTKERTFLKIASSFATSHPRRSLLLIIFYLVPSYPSHPSQTPSTASSSSLSVTSLTSFHSCSRSCSPSGSSSTPSWPLTKELEEETKELRKKLRSPRSLAIPGGPSYMFTQSRNPKFTLCLQNLFSPTAA